MFDESIISLASLVVALVSVLVGLTAVVVSYRERQSRRRTDDSDRRRLLVGEVLEKIDRVARIQSRPVFGRMWAKPEFEIALAMPKLELLIENHEQPVVDWLNLQIRFMHRAPSDRAAAVIGIESAALLAEWFRGYRPLGWFKAALDARADTPLPPAKRTVRRQLQTSTEATAFTILSLAVTSLSLVAALKLERCLAHRG